MIVTSRVLHEIQTDHLIGAVRIIKSLQDDGKWRAKFYEVDIYPYRSDLQYFDSNNPSIQLFYPTNIILPPHIISQMEQQRREKIIAGLKDILNFFYPHSTHNVSFEKNHFHIDQRLMPKKSSLRLAGLHNNSMIVAEVERFIRHLEDILNHIDKFGVHYEKRVYYPIFYWVMQKEKNLECVPLIPSVLP